MLVAPALAFAVLAAAGVARADTAKLPLPTQGPVRFVMLGDSGTGGAGQLAVAAAVQSVCQARGCQFALDAGDNIYEMGVDSDADAQFQAKFEKPYAALSFPFFMALGNHDQSTVIPGSGGNKERGDFEVAYTKRSSRWILPERYYRFAAPFAKSDDYRVSVPKPLIEFFVIDTNPLAPQNLPISTGYRPGEAYDRAQRAWLHQAVASSAASWKAVLGHHPYRNNGHHGNAGDFAGLGLSKGGALKEFFEQEVCGKVDFLLAGHDHDLQWLEPYPSCGAKPQFLISGASAKSNGPESEDPKKRANQAIFEAYRTLGFFWLEVTEQKIHVAAFTVDHAGKAALAIERDVSH